MEGFDVVMGPPGVAVMTAETRGWVEAEGWFDAMVRLVAGGKSLLEICEESGHSYAAVAVWIHEDRVRKLGYEAALEARGEWMKQKVIEEVRKIALVDIRKAYDAEGNLLAVKDMPEEVARCIQGISITQGKNGERVNVKFLDKLKALELLGRQLDMFHVRVDAQVESLSDLIERSMQIVDAEAVVRDAEAVVRDAEVVIHEDKAGALEGEGGGPDGGDDDLAAPDLVSAESADGSGGEPDRDDGEDAGGGES